MNHKILFMNAPLSIEQNSLLLSTKLKIINMNHRIAIAYKCHCVTENAIRNNDFNPY